MCKKADVTQVIKELVAASYNFLQEVLSKLEIKSKTGIHFTSNFDCYSIQHNIMVGRGFLTPLNYEGLLFPPPPFSNSVQPPFLLGG